MERITVLSSTETEMQMNIIYDIIKERYKGNRFPPSVREICSIMGFASTSTAHRYLKMLAERKMIILVPGVNRGIILPPEDDAEEEKTEKCIDTERGERHENDKNKKRNRRAV